MVQYYNSIRVYKVYDFCPSLCYFNNSFQLLFFFFFFFLKYKSSIIAMYSNRQKNIDKKKKICISVYVRLSTLYMCIHINTVLFFHYFSRISSIFTFKFYIQGNQTKMFTKTNKRTNERMNEQTKHMQYKLHCITQAMSISSYICIQTLACIWICVQTTITKKIK